MILSPDFTHRLTILIHRLSGRIISISFTVTVPIPIPDRKHSGNLQIFQRTQLEIQLNPLMQRIQSRQIHPYTFSILFKEISQRLIHPRGTVQIHVSIQPNGTEPIPQFKSKHFLVHRVRISFVAHVLLQEHTSLHIRGPGEIPDIREHVVILRQIIICPSFYSISQEVLLIRLSIGFRVIKMVFPPIGNI